jgi:hypothetical protein
MACDAANDDGPDRGGELRHLLRMMEEDAGKRVSDGRTVHHPSHPWHAEYGAVRRSFRKAVEDAGTGRRPGNPPGPFSRPGRRAAAAGAGSDALGTALVLAAATCAGTCAAVLFNWL